jgi:hypothetical protein
VSAPRQLTLDLIAALRARAEERAKVRRELRQLSDEGKLRQNSDAPSWASFNRAEEALNKVLTAWERAEGFE